MQRAHSKPTQSHPERTWRRRRGSSKHHTDPQHPADRHSIFPPKTSIQIKRISIESAERGLFFFCREGWRAVQRSNMHRLVRTVQWRRNMQRAVKQVAVKQACDGYSGNAHCKTGEHVCPLLYGLGMSGHVQGCPLRQSRLSMQLVVITNAIREGSDL